MEPLRNLIVNSFGNEPQPVSNSLVVADGFDVLDKESAVAFYSGKSWEAVLAHLHGLKDEPVFGAAYYLEEWSVLSHAALSYYLRAHLEFLFEQLGSDHPNEDYIVFFLHSLYQVIHIHKGSPFSPDQTTQLQKIAVIAAEAARDEKLFPYAGKHIVDNVEQFLTELKLHQKGN